MNRLQANRARVDTLVWHTDLATVPAWQARLTGAVRILLAIVRDLADGQLSLRAMSLVYTTLLSLVPLLAVSFSVLKGLGIHNEVEPVLLRLLEPLGEQGMEITRRIIGFVENVKVGVLGSLGLALLVWTVISLLQKIERAFNFTWQIEQNRSFVRRFSDYLSVLLIGPLMVFMALGITASVTSNKVVDSLLALEPFGTALAVSGKILPYLFVIGAFTFIYIFIPNTRVQFRSALAGGVVAGVLWETTGWAFAAFIAISGNSVTTAIYSSFAILIFFMFWLYLSWLILLTGASIAFYHQHPETLSTPQREFRLSARVREKAALLVMFLIGKSFYHDEQPWDIAGLARKLGTRRDAMAWLVGALERKGLLTSTTNEPPTLLPCHDLEHISLKRILDAIRTTEEVTYLNVERVGSALAVDHIVDEIDDAVEKRLAGRTLKDLVLAHGHEEAAGDGIKDSA